MKVVELSGVAHTLTLKNGKTFRIFARATKTVADDLISKEFYLEEKMGGIKLIPEVKIENKEVKKKEVISK